MKNIVIILLVLFGNLYGIEKDKIARLHYKGGGDWYNDPDTIPNIIKFVNRILHCDFPIDQAVIAPSDSKIADYPMIFMTGHGKIKFSTNEAEILRQYLLRGGFLYADDDYGMDESFRKEIKKIFPTKNLIELPPTHEIFHNYYSFPQGLPKIHKHNDKRPQAFAIYDDNGRIMVLYTYESNISDGWTAAHNDPQKIRDLAFKFGVNIFYYLFTH